MKGLGIAHTDRMGGKDGGSVRDEFHLTHGIINTWRKKEHGSDGTHGDVTTASIVNAGRFTMGGPWIVPTDNVITPGEITANTDNYRPVDIDIAVILRLSTDASRNLTGIYQFDTTLYRWLLLVNRGSQNIVLKHNVTSTAAYRFACPGSADYTLTASVWLLYDAGIGNWRVIDQ